MEKFLILSERQENNSLSDEDQTECPSSEEEKDILVLASYVLVDRIINDLDWEVKLQCLKFFRLVVDVDDSLSSFFRPLAVAKLNDYDTVVAEEARKLVNKLDHVNDDDIVKHPSEVLLDELDSLLEDVLHRLSSKAAVNLSHHSHGGEADPHSNLLFVDYGVDMDCY